MRSVHGDSQIRCDTPPGAQAEQCALIQSVVAEDRSNAGLTVIVLKTADQKSRLMRVVAPFGVLLPSGLGLKLDNVGRRPGRLRPLPAQWLRCRSRDGRQAVGQLRSAKTATFIIFETPEEGIGFPLSLNGLGEGYDKLPGGLPHPGPAPAARRTQSTKRAVISLNCSVISAKASTMSGSKWRPRPSRMIAIAFSCDMAPCRRAG